MSGVNVGRLPVVTCYCDTDLVHASYAVTGLIELADAGEIELHFRLRDRAVGRYRGVWTLWCRVRFEETDEFGICIDFHDAADYYCPRSLTACRSYYKSNLRSDTFDAVPPHLRGKLRPFGPYLPCRPLHDRSIALRRFGSLYSKFTHRFFVAVKPMSLPQKVRHLLPELKRYQRYLSRKTWPEYESPSIDVSPSSPFAVVYNPTCWDESEGESVRQMNAFRARLIAGLRETFGDRFVGGFRRSETAIKRYPEAVERYPFSHDEFLRLANSTPIAIYGNGTASCFSWRLAEALAASKCIVSERIPNLADGPLDESIGCIQCDDVPAMIEAVHRLDADPATVAEYGRRAGRYYVEHLRPAVRMRSLLRELASAEAVRPDNAPDSGDRPALDDQTDPHILPMIDAGRSA